MNMKGIPYFILDQVGITLLDCKAIYELKILPTKIMLREQILMPLEETDIFLVYREKLILV
jgi:hypothetical protein